ETGRRIDRAVTDYFDRHHDTIERAAGGLSEYLGGTSERTEREELMRTVEQLYLKGLKEGRLEFRPGVSAANLLAAIRRGEVWGLDESLVKVLRRDDLPGGPPAKWSSEYLVWADDMGALHVGTLEQFHALQRHKDMLGGGSSDELLRKIP